MRNAFILITALFANAQEPAPTPKVPAKEFEVASIKPSDPGAHGARVQVAPGGRYTASNVTVKMLIQQAYEVKGFQITGGPGWLGTEHFDIVAKGEGAVGPDDFKPMLQALLNERFHLVFHRESKEMPVYALVPGKNGPKLAENKEAAGPNGGSNMMINRGRLTAKKITMAMLANQLSNQLGRNVLDKTGIAGEYDIKLEWTPDQPQNAGPGGPGPDAPPPTADAGGPTIFTALQEQLGLKLESQKGPISMLIVDSAEKASEN